MNGVCCSIDWPDLHEWCLLTWCTAQVALSDAAQQGGEGGAGWCVRRPALRARRPRAPLIADANKKPLAGLFTHLFGALFISFIAPAPQITTQPSLRNFIWKFHISLGALRLLCRRGALRLASTHFWTNTKHFPTRPIARIEKMPLNENSLFLFLSVPMRLITKIYSTYRTRVLNDRFIFITRVDISRHICFSTLKHKITLLNAFLDSLLLILVSKILKYTFANFKQSILCIINHNQVISSK